MDTWVPGVLTATGCCCSPAHRGPCSQAAVGLASHGAAGGSAVKSFVAGTVASEVTLREQPLSVASGSAGSACCFTWVCREPQEEGSFQELFQTLFWPGLSAPPSP